MNIFYDKISKIFMLQMRNSTYSMKIVDDGYLAHVYFGRKILNEDISYLLRLNENPFTPTINMRDKAVFMDTISLEYPCYGIGDFREHSFQVLDENGMSTTDIRYVSHIIYKGKPKLQNLPATFANENEFETLEITCIDKILNLEVTLIYSLFYNYNAITRSVKVKNNSSSACNITRVLSSSLDFDNSEYDMVSFYGSWARERHLERSKLRHGKQVIDSLRGESSHQHNPFIAICSQNAGEDYGEVYGFSLVYSGNFYACSEVSQHDKTRVAIGINPTDFNWLLEKDETFQTPEVVIVYSQNGFGEMSRTYHDIYRNHLIRGVYKDRERPVLINNWEATYFDFNTQKLISIAKQASELGIEMLVMDDGWFGHRDSDNSSLGDWFIYKEKIDGGLKNLVDEVNKLGLKFGIWFEPEMVSPDSNLFKEHPDWAIQIKGRDLTLCREQYVLDFSNKNVRDYIYNLIKNILSSANIEYVKWDMNRQLTEVGSNFLPQNRQRELWHRYVLGVYELMERLITDFPNLLLENCSGGGARFDAGMLYYSPQIWASDNTDAIERLKIQYGTSMCYPLSSIGAHVSDCPNHSVGRVTPFKTRGHIALLGTFGYELDITKISEDDKQEIKNQIQDYKTYNHIMRNGDQYRIGNIFIDNTWDAWIIVSKDKLEALFTYVQVLGKPNFRSKIVKLKGLNPNFKYKNMEINETFSGSTLMNAGIIIKNMWGDFQSKIIYFKID